MPMSPRLLRPRASGPGFFPQVTNADARDWLTRVYVNGGTVSNDTAAAVNTFCTSIAAESGLRAAILRLNLFCGNSDASLAAVRTPLYRGASLGGTQLGNTTDTNFNFVSGDYQETGSGGGLKGNGSSKYLDTGLAPASFSVLSSTHLSFSGTSLETSGDAIGVGSFNGTEGTCYIADIWAAYAAARAVRLNSFSQITGTPPTNNQFPYVASPGTVESHFIGTRTATNSSVLYRGGTSASTSSYASSQATSTRPFFVFALNNTGSPSTYTAGRLRMYSIGNGLTAAQALAFANAVIAFNTALGRA